MMLYIRDNEMRAEGRAEGKILGAIGIMRDDGKTDDEIITRLMSKFKLTLEEAEEYVKMPELV